MRLVLGSASPARLGVLRSAGVDPDVIVSEVDEDALLTELGDATPAEKVTALAIAKARAVASQVPTEEGDVVVVGCDSMLDIDGELVGKPHTVENARARWERMAGRHGELVTGHALVRLRGGVADAEISGHATTFVTFAEPSPAALDAYLASGEPLQVAGAFTLDGLGGWLVEGIQGDPSNVIGISLPLVRRLLAELGIEVSDLWRAPATG
ncbi:Maf family protein [Actinomycetospora termitidis]|uniref:Nucleoside triphosphate pyrophosphatase n=1 Tax=Actinomycetospora termitidis TaxID=3053470 RepID=A0ABT7MHW9_9PSEU|nr:nucleoside triphosphate pyrophosphatase [Actinomycetospora sp. Odt1-22]MDL5160281.1 nucleoside triphosphate pyrophosphatase [Actinomycetospora sp. Odt1-22]